MTAAGRFKILVPIGCRSDEGLSAPVIRRLKAQEWCIVETVQLIPQEFLASYAKTECCIQHGNPDLILVVGDRVEMCAAAAAAFHNKVKIAHLYAGVVNDPVTTFDDVDRHCITLWSDLIFCETDEAADVVYKLKTAFKGPAQIFPTGITHLDDLEVDENDMPPEPYDLVLINAEPLTENLPNFCKDRYTVWIGGNPDGYVHDNG